MTRFRTDLSPKQLHEGGTARTMSVKKKHVYNGRGASWVDTGCRMCVAVVPTATAGNTAENSWQQAQPTPHTPLTLLPSLGHHFRGRLHHKGLGWGPQEEGVGVLELRRLDDGLAQLQGPVRDARRRALQTQDVAQARTVTARDTNRGRDEEGGGMRNVNKDRVTQTHAHQGSQQPCRTRIWVLPASGQASTMAAAGRGK